jgi:hypothetical protein
MELLKQGSSVVSSVVRSVRALHTKHTAAATVAGSAEVEDSDGAIGKDDSYCYCTVVLMEVSCSEAYVRLLASMQTNHVIVLCLVCYVLVSFD